MFFGKSTVILARENIPHQVCQMELTSALELIIHNNCLISNDEQLNFGEYVIIIYNTGTRDVWHLSHQSTRA